MTRRLIAREAAENGAFDDATVAHRACERAYHQLARWLGATGCRTLFARALAQTRGDHIALVEMRLGTSEETALTRVREAVDSYGAPAVARALGALLVEIVALLGRLIGEDMAARLVEEGIHNNARTDASPT